MRTPINVRNFDSTFRELAARGHELHVTFERLKSRTVDQTTLVDALCEELPRVTQGMAPIPDADDALYRRAAAIRYAIDYVRYFTPGFRDAVKLRKRAAERAPSWALRLGRLGIARRPQTACRVIAGLRRVERAIPQDARYETFLREQRPDVVLVSPLVHVGPQGQVELLRAARRQGIATGLLVHSWDNLTTKGLIHEVPDMVAVWNEDQVTEAVEMHGVPRARLAVTGAPTFDQWFDWSPSSGREAFCRRVGLDPAEPYLLYLGSSGFIAPRESEYAADWLSQLREYPGLRDVGVLVRPHPAAAHWIDFDERRWDNVAIHPRTGGDPISSSTKADYFDSIYHSAAVVGVNTSALIETAIVGRSAHTLLVPEYSRGQEGTLHFAYLARENGGPLVVTRTTGEHFAGLVRAVAGDADGDEVTRAFVRRFVRPLGDDVSATEALADSIERLAGAARPLRAPSRLAGGLHLAVASAGESLFEGAQRLSRRG